MHVLRTEANVPHIYASNRNDLLRVQGFTLARDRYFQFELARRLGQGRLSELLGSLGLSIDQQSVGQGQRALTARIFENLTETQRADFDAFAEGINDYIRAAQAGELPAPSELGTVSGLLGATEPTDLMTLVDARDVAGFAAFIVYQLGFETSDMLREAVRQAAATAYPDDVAHADLRRAGAVDDIADRVAPVRDVASAEFPGGSDKQFGRAVPRASMAAAWRSFAQQQGLDEALVERMIRQHQRSEAVFGRGDLGDHGSNTWAMNTNLEGFSSLLAGDGHLSLGVAPFFYQMARHTWPLGDGEIDEVGLYFPGLPMMGVGTNGRVAWSQTYLYGDITDFYASPVQLGNDGEPATYGPDAAPLQRVEDVYEVAPVLGAGGTETWAHWITDRGLWLAEIEGREIDSPGDAEEGETVVNMQGAWIVPADLDEDGEITGIFFDYVGFDLGDTLGAVERFAQADTVDDFLQETDALFAYAGNFVVADRDGHIAYTSYNATPCRYALGSVNQNQAQNTPWPVDRDPRYVITGDLSGFEIPNTPDGRIDASFADDPTRCVIARADWPVNVDPDSGYVLNANNDPAGGTFDNSPYNDQWYLGVGYSTGYRADTIDRGLAALAQGPSLSGSDAGLRAMADLQGNVNSPTARDFLPPLIDALLAAQNGTASPLAQAAYDAAPERMDEVLQRLQAWEQAGMPAESGVDTFYQTHTEEERAHAVATTLYNEWLKAFSNRVFADEDLDVLFSPSPNEIRLRTLLLMLRSRGEAGNVDQLSSFDATAGESVYFDDLATAAQETSDDCVVGAMADALERLAATSNSPDVGGFGTTDMSQWLWGLRHQVRFRSVLIEFAGGNPVVDIVAADFNINTDVLPLAPTLASSDPRADLTWFPRHGDLFAVDAPNFPLTARDYFYSSGPVMRMVFALGPDGVVGQNILPGGQSGLIDSPHFADQAALWLGNDTIPVRFDVESVVEGATSRETFTP